MSVEGFVRVGRAKKVAALLRHVDASATVAEDAALADELSHWTRTQRLILAKAANVREPSADSWAALMVAIRERLKPTSRSRDARIPAHICHFHIDDTNHCKVCGERVDPELIR